MENTSDVRRLAEVTAGLAATLVELVNERVRAAATIQEQKIAQKTLEPLLTKQQAAEYFQVTPRTLEIWMKRGQVPYYRIGRNIRIKLSDVETLWRERYMVRSRSR